MRLHEIKIALKEIMPKIISSVSTSNRKYNWIAQDLSGVWYLYFERPTYISDDSGQWKSDGDYEPAYIVPVNINTKSAHTTLININELMGVKPELDSGIKNIIANIEKLKASIDAKYKEDIKKLDLAIESLKECEL